MASWSYLGTSLVERDVASWLIYYVICHWDPPPPRMHAAVCMYVRTLPDPREQLPRFLPELGGTEVRPDLTPPPRLARAGAQIDLIV